MATASERDTIGAQSFRQLVANAPASPNHDQQACINLFQSAMEEIPPNLQWAFTTVMALRRKLGNYIKTSCGPDGRTIYISVSGVLESTLDEVLGPLRNRIQLRVWWEGEAPAGIITLMPSARHEFSAGRFISNIPAKIWRIPGHDVWSTSLVGASRYSVPGRRSKEGSGGLRCSTRVGAASWPNLMVEVGFSESLQMLRFDAQWWLLASGGLTRMVILIRILSNPNSMHIEAWELQPNQRRSTRSSPSHIPAKSYSIDIDAAGNTSHNLPLNIPYGVLFDTPRANQADTQFTANELSMMAQRVFIDSQ